MKSCDRIVAVLTMLAQQAHVRTYQTLMDLIARQYGKDPLYLLIACLLSLRARDAMVLKMFPRVAQRIKTAQDLRDISIPELESLIRSIGFYRAKARTLKQVAAELIDRFDGVVPRERRDLLSIKGIGQKTGNLVLWYTYGVEGVAVDIHVYRVCNRLGIVKTKTADQTQRILEKCLPRNMWHVANHACVAHGQQICLPVSPWCSKCPMRSMCLRVGVRCSR